MLRFSRSLMLRSVWNQTSFQPSSSSSLYLPNVSNINNISFEKQNIISLNYQNNFTKNSLLKKNDSPIITDEYYEPEPAIDLINDIPPKEVNGTNVSCDGGGGPLGHPKVYINLDVPNKPIACPYCGLRFVNKGNHH
eukprot:TRINITY_DN136710_c0_g1_i1.p1 TRINITY_DN136710_c0_g1~~TRINITY_DN136710_c0_g1_i1.p1  ORF type:complete len:137 (+),score=17.13 TRINITY_DN136710_c0_g1_i1:45-455(+)